MVRTKFMVDKVTQYASGDAKVELSPVYSEDLEHINRKFWKDTPTGLIQMRTKSEIALNFTPGEEYYVDFTLAKDVDALSDVDYSKIGFYDLNL